MAMEAKKEAQSVVPDPSLSKAWTEKECFVMKIACQNKFSSCEHAWDALLHSKSELAEATRDRKWGTGLDKVQTIKCLPDCWPGENWMGYILKEIHLEVLEEERLSKLDTVRTDKRKEVSPLASELK